MLDPPTPYVHTCPFSLDPPPPMSTRVPFPLTPLPPPCGRLLWMTPNASLIFSWHYDEARFQLRNMYKKLRSLVFFPGQLAFCKKAVEGLAARRIF